MIRFNELKISPDSRYLLIDISVLEETYYKGVFIDSIVIDNQDTYVNNGPSSNPVYSYTVIDDTTALSDKPVGPKYLRLVLDARDLGGSLDNMFFIYVRAKGTPAADTPCGMDNITTMGTVVNIYPFYQQAMNYIGELADTCLVPQNFIDYILKLKALELAVKTGNYTEAINYYNRFFNNNKENFTMKGGCGCGRH